MGITLRVEWILIHKRLYFFQNECGTPLNKIHFFKCEFNFKHNFCIVFCLQIGYLYGLLEYTFLKQLKRLFSVECHNFSKQCNRDTSLSMRLSLIFIYLCTLNFISVYLLVQKIYKSNFYNLNISKNTEFQI